MKIVITSNQGKQVEFDLNSEALLIGRNANKSGYILTSPKTSREHAILHVLENKVCIKDLDSAHGTFVNNKRIEPHANFYLKSGDTIRFADETVIFTSANQNASETGRKPYRMLKSLSSYFLGEGKKVVGRDEDCDIIIEHPSVSGKHAVIYKSSGGNYYVEDLNSLNGTFVNNKKIPTKVKIQLSETDRIFFGLQSYSVNHDSEDLSSSQSIAIEAVGIECREKRVLKFDNKDEKVFLQPVNIKIKKGFFVALMGPSGCGKSTLLKALNNDQPATSGIVKIFGLDISDPNNFNRVKRSIGYASQGDNIHDELTVIQALFFAAKLRLPAGVADDAIYKQIDTILYSLNLNAPDFKEKKIKKLSGGQKKRVAIAVELLNDPSILFLDEPTSPLDPETISEFLATIKNLCRKTGITVIMVTHKPEDLKFADEIIFMGSGGFIVYKGKPDGIFNFFKLNSITEIYAKVNKYDNAKRYSEEFLKGKPQTIPYPASSVKQLKIENPFSQIWWLTSRSLQLKINDIIGDGRKRDFIKGLFSIFGIPILVSWIIIAVYPNLTLSAVFIIVILTVFLGVFGAVEEIVNERNIFKRERLFNLRIWTYYFSKILSVSAQILVQVFILFVFVYYRYSSSVEGVQLHQPGYLFFFLFVLALSSAVLGFFISSVVGNIRQAMYSLLFILILQMLFAGTSTKIDSHIKEVTSFFVHSRWGMQGFSLLQVNSDYDNEQAKGVLVTKTTFTKKDTVIPLDTVIKIKPENLPNEITYQFKHNKVISLDVPTPGSKELTGANPLSILDFLSESRLISKYDKHKISLKSNDEIKEKPLLKTAAGTYACLFVLNIILILLTFLFLRIK